MSVEATSLVYRVTFGSPTMKFVMMSLADRADENWSCFPSISDISERTEFSYRAVQKALDDLESHGWITRERQKRADGTLGVYRFRLSMGQLSEYARTPVIPPARGAYGGNDHRHQVHIPPAPGAYSPPAPGATLNHQLLNHQLTTNKIHTSIDASISESDAISKAKDRSKARTELTDEQFAKFWHAYPIKVGKPVARKAFDKAMKRADMEAIMHGLETYKETKPSEYNWAHPSTWLNQDRWEDQPYPETKSIKQVNENGPYPAPSSAKFVARQANLARSLAGAESAARRYESERG